MYPVVMQGNSKVHKVNAVGALTDFPCNTEGGVIHAFFKVLPACAVSGLIGSMPSTEDVVDKTAVHPEVLLELSK